MKKPVNSAAAQLIDPMASRLGYQLRRASVLMMADLGTRLAPTGLRPAEVSILLLVGANPGCRQGELGEALGIKPSNMVPLIGGLIEQELVARARTGRSIALSLTPKGRAMAVTLGKLLDRHEAIFQSRLDRKHLSTVLAALAALRA
jgi:DNA-binding MarR family transcriptional regulator